ISGFRCIRVSTQLTASKGTFYLFYESLCGRESSTLHAGTYIGNLSLAVNPNHHIHLPFKLTVIINLRSYFPNTTCQVQRCIAKARSEERTSELQSREN